MPDTSKVANAPHTPDYDTYRCDHALTSASADGSVVTVTWDDGRVSR